MGLLKRQGGAMMEKVLADYPVVVETPVAWGEMDAFGHVNNSVYYRYFETARIAYFEKLNFPEFLGRDPIGPILAETTCRFRAALSYPDTVSIGAGVVSIGEDRFVMRYAVLSHRLARLAAEGEGTMVCFDYRQNRKAPLPEKLRRRIEEIEGGLSKKGGILKKVD
jgi:acyl-CoA thioester hydrolase